MLWLEILTWSATIITIIGAIIWIYLKLRNLKFKIKGINFLNFHSPKKFDFPDIDEENQNNNST